MAFRLQSAIAGGAKRLSEKMTAFDENYAETLKNSAANLAKEAANIRKERMIAVRDYKSKGQILMDDYGLSEAQVASLLQGGTDRYDKFLTDVESGAMQHVRSGVEKPFDQSDYIQNTLFSSQQTKEGGTQPTYMSLDEQADLYGKLTVPSTIDMGGEIASVVAGTQRGIFKMDPATVRSALGDVATGAERYEGPGFTPTGLSYTSPALSAAQQVAYEQAIATKKKTEADTRVSEQRIKNMAAETGFAADANRRANAAEARLAKAFPKELEKLEASIGSILQDTANKELTAEKVALEIETMQETGLESARLGNQLLQARIIDTARYDDIEQLWLGSVQAVDNLKMKRAEAERLGESQEALTALDAQIDSAQAIADENWKLVKLDANKASSLFSKVNLPSSYNSAIKQAALGFNVELNFSSFDEAVRKFGEGQLPAWLTSADQALKEIQISYGDYPEGKNFITGKMRTLGSQISSYASQTDFNDPTPVYFTKKKPIDFGVAKNLVVATKKEDRAEFLNALDSLARHPNGDIKARAGDIIRVPMKNGGEKVYIFGVNNKWIGY